MEKNTSRKIYCVLKANLSRPRSVLNSAVRDPKAIAVLSSDSDFMIMAEGRWISFSGAMHCVHCQHSDALGYTRHNIWYLVGIRAILVLAFFEWIWKDNKSIDR